MAAHSRRNSDVPAYDHNPWGWVMVAAVFLNALIIFGNLKALGVIIIVLKDDFDTNLWVVGWIAVMHFGVQLIFTPFAAATSRLVGSRPVIVTGGILTALGFSLASTSSTVIELAVYLVVIAGLGSACTLMILLSNMALYFDKNYAVACAISLCGVSVGFMVYGPLSQLLLDTYGWRGTCILLGGLSLHIVVCGALTRPRRKQPHGRHDYRRVRGQEQPQDNLASAKREGGFEIEERENSYRTTRLDTPGANEQKWTKISCADLGRSLDLAVFCETRFNLQATSAFFSEFGFEGWLVFLVPFGQLTGLDPWQASFLPMAVGFGNIIGKITTAVLFQKTTIPGQCTLAISAMICSVTFIVVPFAPSFVGQLSTNFVLAVAFGLCHQSKDVLLRYVLTDERVVSVYGWQGLIAGVSGIIGGFFTGWLHDVTHSIVATYVMFSVSMVVTAAFIMADYIYLLHSQRAM